MSRYLLQPTLVDARQWTTGVHIPNVTSSPVLEPSEDNPTGHYGQVALKDGGFLIVRPGEWILYFDDGKRAVVSNELFETVFRQVDRRPSWDDYFMAIARCVATRATCDRKHVGAVITVDNTIVSTGYNGAPRGLEDCDTVGHLLKDMGGRQSCVRTAHAEANALAQAARTGTSVAGGTLYTTASTCYDCAKLVINAGIARVVADEFYASRYGESGSAHELFRNAGVLCKMPDAPR